MGWAGRYKNGVCPKTAIKQWERCGHVSFNQRMCQDGLAVRVYLYIYIWVNLPEDLLDDQVEDVKSPSMMTVVELVMSQVYRIEGQGTFQNPGAQNSPCGDCSQEDHG